MRKKKEIVGTIETLEFPNKSILICEGKSYVFKGGIPGQKVKIVAKGKKRSFYEAKLVEVLEKADTENHPTCKVFGTCGGCAYQSIDYDEEIKIKEEGIKRLFKDVCTGEFKVNPVLSIKGYRNKMEYTFGDMEKGGPLMLGLHSKGRFYEITPTLECNIVPEGFEIIRQEVQEYFRKTSHKFYRSRLYIGLLRHLVIKYSFSKDEYMVNIVTTSQEDWDRDKFVEHLKNITMPGKIKTIIHTINDSLSDAVKAEKIQTLYGPGYLEEELLGLKFHMGPFSFFQPNPQMAKVLYSRALELAGNISNKTVFDLYSGTGTIGQIFSKKAKKVYGIEIVEEAVEKAKDTCRLNKIENCEFIQGDVLEKIEELRDLAEIIVLDPPREGIHPKALEKLLKIKPEKFVYISCNPVTQARDLRIMKDFGYKVEQMEIVDQFPRTYHVETIALIQKM